LAGGLDGHAGKRLFSLQLSPVVLAMLARNRQDDHEAMDAILAEYGPEAFAYHWLRREGFVEAAERLRQGGTREETPDEP
jgi:type IV secretion system protein VirB4